MNRSIHFRVSDAWFNLATARAEKLGLNLSEYIRSTVSKDCEEEKMRQKEFIKNYTLGMDNYFDRLSKEEKKKIKQMVLEYPFDLDVSPNIYDIFGTKLELLPVERPLSPTMEEEIDKIIKQRLEDLKKEYKKEIWVLMNPDNEHWDEKFAQEEIDLLSKRWNVNAVSTSQTRDGGHGQERLYVVSGNSEAVEEFEKELEVALY